MKKNNPVMMRSGSVLFAFLLFTILSGTIFAQTTQLPIDFYLSSYPPGSFTQVWQDPTTGDQILIDAYNKRNTVFSLGLPTVTEGKVSIQPLKAGMVQYTVNGHTRNAFCSGFKPSGIAFGFLLSEVTILGRTPALGNVNYRIVYAPQPAAGPFNVFGAMEFFSASVQCEGPLRAASGFAEGTPGFAQTRQTGLLGVNPRQGCPPEKDANCFPAEKIQFKPR